MKKTSIKFATLLFAILVFVGAVIAASYSASGEHKNAYYNINVTGSTYGYLQAYGSIGTSPVASTQMKWLYGGMVAKVDTYEYYQFRVKPTKHATYEMTLSSTNQYTGLSNCEIVRIPGNSYYTYVHKGTLRVPGQSVIVDEYQYTANQD